MPERPLRVQFSFPTPRSVYNPYTIMLAEAVAGVPGVEVRHFSWRGVLLKRFDVFHCHWPEGLISGRSPAKDAVRQVLLVLLIMKLAILRVPIVRTQHNLGRPDGLSLRQSRLLDLVDRRTSLFIVLNDLTPVPAGAATELIPHGHYRDWYRSYPRADQVVGQIGFVGRIRRYKGVQRLLTGFAEVDESQTGPLRLWIGGLPSTPELEGELRELVGADQRISLNMGFQSDADVVRALSEAELVVLPYREMHNSGAALLALSLDRPVLLPDNELNRQLSDEVGAGWLYFFQEEPDGKSITEALAGVRSGSRTPRPDLSRREWPQAGQRHVSAYRRAAELLRGHG